MDPEALAALREQIGEERFESRRRSKELLRHPRPLTDTEGRVLRETAAPLLTDLAASGMSLPDIREEAHEERLRASVCGWIQGPGRTGEGLWILLEMPVAGREARLAEQFQNWAADQLHDAGIPPEWPACPEHPSPPGRLQPEVRDGAAVWVCSESGQVIWPIAALAGPSRQPRKRSRRDRRR